MTTTPVTIRPLGPLVSPRAHEIHIRSITGGRVAPLTHCAHPRGCERAALVEFRTKFFLFRCCRTHALRWLQRYTQDWQDAEISMDKASYRVLTEPWRARK